MITNIAYSSIYKAVDYIDEMVLSNQELDEIKITNAIEKHLKNQDMEY